VAGENITQLGHTLKQWNVHVAETGEALPTIQNGKASIGWSNIPADSPLGALEVVCATERKISVVGQAFTDLVAVDQDTLNKLIFVARRSSESAARSALDGLDKLGLLEN
jgi:hypothetical protein